MDEVDVHPVDLGDELRQRVQPRRDAPEVVLVQPVATERLQSRELDALRAIGDELLAWPARRGNAAAQIVELLFGTSIRNGLIAVVAMDITGILGAGIDPSVSGGSEARIIRCG